MFKVKEILLILSFIIGITFGKVVYISSYGFDEKGCGSQQNTPCKTFEYGIKSAMAIINQENLPKDIELIVYPSQYFIETSINLYGFNVSIAPISDVGILDLAKSIGNYYPMFYINVQEEYWKYGLLSTQFKVRDLTISGCDVYTGFSQGSLLQINDNNNSVPINVELNNIQFSCSLFEAPLISYSGDNSLVAQSSTDSDLSTSYSSSDNYDNSDDDVKKVKYSYSSGSNYNSGSSSYNNGESNSTYEDDSSNSYSSSYSNNYQSSSNGDYSYSTFYDNQLFGSWPVQNSPILITFTFNNIVFAPGFSSLTDPLFFKAYDSINAIQLNLMNSFIYGISTPSFIRADSASVYMKNVTFEQIVSADSTNNFLNFDYSRLTLNNVSISGTFYSNSLLQCSNCLVIANQFNLNFYGYYNAILLTNSMATIENSNHTIVSSDSYISNIFYSLSKSSLYLFSNIITGVDNAIFASSKSSIFVNRNTILLKATPGSSYNNKGQVCSSTVDYDTKIFGDYDFVENFVSNCYGALSNNKVETLYLLLAFFIGVFVIVIFFIIAYTISAICKCKRRKKKLAQYKEIN